MRVAAEGTERRGRVVSKAYSMKAGILLYEVALDEPLPNGRERILLTADELAAAKK